MRRVLGQNDQKAAILAELAPKTEKPADEKAAILAALTPKNGKLADEKGAWLDILAWVRFYDTDQEIKQIVKAQKGLSSEQRKRKLRQIAVALGKARTLVEEALKTPDLASDLQMAWRDGQGAAVQDLFDPSNEMKKSLDRKSVV